MALIRSQRLVHLGGSQSDCAIARYFKSLLLFECLYCCAWESLAFAITSGRGIIYHEFGIRFAILGTVAASSVPKIIGSGLSSIPDRFQL